MDILAHNINEEKSYIVANAIGNLVGNLIRRIMVWFLKNCKAVIFVILGGGFFMIVGIFASILWGKRAKR